MRLTVSYQYDAWGKDQKKNQDNYNIQKNLDTPFKNNLLPNGKPDFFLLFANLVKIAK